MDLYLYLLLGVVVIVLALVLFFVFRKPTKNEKVYDLSEIKNLLDKSTVLNINYIRNKIVIEFEDVNNFDTESLLVYGALGINIVGDKVKFYLDGGNDKNEKVFKELKRYIEG